MANDDLNKKLTELMQGQLMLLLPEDEIRTKVDTVIDEFFTRKPSNYHGGKSQPSAFEVMVVKHLEEKAKQVIESLFNSPAWKVSVNDKLEVLIGDSLQKVLGIKPEILSDYAAKAAATSRALLLASMLRDALYATNTDMGNAFYNYVSNNAKSL